MPRVISPPLPEGALLARYETSDDYTDCFAIDVPGDISLAEFIQHFYASSIFWPERKILGLIGKGANQDDIAALADGSADKFAAWHVEARSLDQILLCDFRGSTRSWLHVSPVEIGTRLWFGSAVVAKAKSDGDKALPSLARALMGFHTVYSRLLLQGAARAFVA